MDIPDLCPEERNSSKIYIGVFIILGIVISYVPQLLKFYKLKSSEGLSPYFLGLGMIGTISTWMNTFMLQFAAMSCCQTHWEADVCFQNTLGFTQMTVQGSCFIALFTLFYTFYPISLKYATPSSPTTTKLSYSAAYKATLWVLLTCLTFIIIVFIVSIATLISGSGDPNRTAIERVAGLWGGIATLTGITQYIPQFWHTFWMGHPGALSVETLLMQCPGSFLFAYSLAIQPRTNWTSWLPFFAAGSLQLVLLMLCFYFIWKNPTLHNSVIIGNPEERERLLGPNDEEILLPSNDSDNSNGEDRVDDEDVSTGSNVALGARFGSPDASSPTRLDDSRQAYEALSRARGKKTRR